MIESESVNDVTATDGDVPDRLISIERAIVHHDTMLHDVHRMVSGMERLLEEFRPLLERGRSLMDPGAGVRRALGIKKAVKP